MTHVRTQPWRRSLSRGAGWTHVLVAIVALVALIVGARLVFRTQEDRLWAFLDDAKAALVEGRDADVLASFDPSVRYQGRSGLDEIDRDIKRWHAIGLPAPTTTLREAAIEDDVARVRMDVVLMAGLRPVAQATVRIRAVERRRGEWAITELSWE
jgi:hypothetical protein